MQYIITFIEGLITFISPCHLPMLPIFLSYLAGGETESSIKKTVLRTLGFIAGFTVIFLALGAFSGLVGELLNRYETAVNIFAGAAVILFGLNFLGVLKLKFLHGGKPLGKTTVTSFFSAAVFGVVFSVCWMPCMMASLGPALMLASHQASIFQGVLLLLCFSAGLGLPFLLSAVLIGKLKTAFNWIKKHYSIVNTVSGIFLIVIGILMMTGILHKFIDLISNHQH